MGHNDLHMSLVCSLCKINYVQLIVGAHKAGLILPDFALTVRVSKQE